MPQTPFAQLIADALQLSPDNVGATLALLAEGCTIPFISRYRKERTGHLDETQIAAIADEHQRLQELARRKETILKTINDQERLTDELRLRIESTWDAAELEDLYLPFKPRRRTRAQIAREQGHAPVAARLLRAAGAPRSAELMDQLSASELIAAATMGDPSSQPAEALQGAKDIIAEFVSEDERSRQQLRGAYRRTAFITSKVVRSKASTDEAAKYADYFDWREPLRRCSSHRLLAMRRGEAEGILRLSIDPADDQECISRLQRHWTRANNRSADLVAEAVDDAYKRLLKPSIETEFANLAKQQADAEAISVFAENLRQLLLSPPLGPKRIIALDPGFRTGCKLVCLDSQGTLLHHEVIYPHPPVNRRMQATVHLLKLIKDYRVEAIAIGNGTAGRETRAFVDDVVAQSDLAPAVFVVSEDGASVYSASKIAREEFPDHDVTVRGAVSIGRRLIDPLAELVKIDPKSIGVGQYQHDVDQSKLKTQLDHVVESCVNLVGVNLNTASFHLLQYVSGLGPALARNIVDFRRTHGVFHSRHDLLKVPRLGPTAFQQCAGFLRVANAENPLDNSAVHPERYAIVEQMARDQGCQVSQLIGKTDLRTRIDLKKYVGKDVGLPTLTDILAELEKPGLDPRQPLEDFHFDSRVHDITDLVVGMTLPGIVTNITNFGAFVDVGVHQDGLVHISQLANHRVSQPTDVVHLHQHVVVRVLDVDLRRHRISLTLRT